MKTQTIAKIEVGTFFVATLVAALLQGSAVAGYAPPTQGAGSGSPTGQTVYTGTRMLDTSCDADCGECYVSGAKGKRVTDADGVQSCKVCE